MSSVCQQAQGGFCACRSRPSVLAFAFEFFQALGGEPQGVLICQHCGLQLFDHAVKRISEVCVVIDLPVFTCVLGFELSPGSGKLSLEDAQLFDCGFKGFLIGAQILELFLVNLLFSLPCHKTASSHIRDSRARYTSVARAL